MCQWMEYAIICTNKTNVVNWRGFGLEVLLSIIKEDFRELPQIIACGEKYPNVVIEGRPSTCYRCHQSPEKDCSSKLEKEGEIIRKEKVEVGEIEE